MYSVGVIRQRRLDLEFFTTDTWYVTLARS
jgi:hypothetical protein